MKSEKYLQRVKTNYSTNLESSILLKFYFIEFKNFENFIDFKNSILSKTQRDRIFKRRTVKENYIQLIVI